MYNSAIYDTRQDLSSMQHCQAVQQSHNVSSYPYYYQQQFDNQYYYPQSFNYGLMTDNHQGMQYTAPDISNYPLSMPILNAQQATNKIDFEAMAASASKPSMKNHARIRANGRYRTPYDEHTKAILEAEYNSCEYITAERKQQLSLQLNLTSRQIKIWFQNRRAKKRRDVKKIIENGQL